MRRHSESASGRSNHYGERLSHSHAYFFRSAPSLCSPDVQAAEDWYRKSAEAGDVEAKYYYAQMMEKRR